MRDPCGLSSRGLAVLIPTVLALVACSPPTEPKPPRTLPIASAPVVGTIGRLPLAFEPNIGQAPADVRYLGRGTGYRLWLTPQGADFAGPSGPATAPPLIRLRLVGGAPAPGVTAEDELPGQVHYFVGEDPRAWRRHVPTYRRVVYRDVYPGIDLVFHGSQREAEFDFVLAPGADARVIGIELRGAHTVTLERGDVIARAGEATLRLRQPVVYQEVGGRRHPVAGRFALHGRRIAFELGAYDRARALVIDPVVTYSTYLGGAGTEAGRAVGVDASGNVYAVVDGLGVVKLSADGRRLLYTSVLGDAQLVALAVDAAGHAYVAGNFAKPRSGVSGVYPVTPNALQPTFGPACNQGDTDGVMAKLAPDGSQLLYASFVGGRCHYTVTGIAVDPSGRIYLTGEGSTAAGYPATRTPFAPSGAAGSPFPAWIQVVAADFSRYVYSTLILAEAGSPVVPTAIAADRAGGAYLAGTTGPGFPTTPGALQPTLASGSAPFVAKISADGARMTYATYFGGATTRVNALAVDPAGRAYLAGHSGPGLPTVGALQPAPAGATDAFVASIEATGSALGFSTYLGGGADDAAVGIGLDGAGNVYVAGPTESTDFPQRQALPARFGAAASNFLTALTPAGSALRYSTYVADGQTVVNALAVTSGGAAHLTGVTSSASFPTERGLRTTFGGGASDAFLMRIDPGSGGALRVLVTAPAEGATVAGTTWLTIWVENATSGDTTYTLSEAGTSLASTTTSSHGPISLPWATAGGADGTRSIAVTVTDRTGTTGSATRTVNVRNGGNHGGGGGGNALRVVISAPTAGAVVSGTAWLTVWLENAGPGAKTYTLGEGGTPLGSTTTSSHGPVSLPWPTTAGANGTRTVTVTVRGAAGSGSATRAFDVQNGGDSLRVAITRPGVGSTVRGTAWFTIWVEGAAAGPKIYSLSQGGTPVATTTSSSAGPVSLAWPTAAADTGPRTVTVSVRDAGGRTGSASVSLEVEN